MSKAGVKAWGSLQSFKQSERVQQRQSGGRRERGLEGKQGNEKGKFSQLSSSILPICTGNLAIYTYIYIHACVLEIIRPQKSIASLFFFVCF